MIEAILIPLCCIGIGACLGQAIYLLHRHGMRALRRRLRRMG